jgi:carbon monoxide dehydrogenase subunit G
MEITGTQSIPAPRARVWQALNDPVILRACLPGCDAVERVGEDAFKVIVAAAIGPLRARFNGSLTITEAKAPESCVMVFQGQGGAIGFGKGSSTVVLREMGEETDLSYSAKAEVGGKLAQVGSRLIDSVARKMSDDFFDAFRKQLAPPAPIEPVSADAATAKGGMPVPDVAEGASGQVAARPGSSVPPRTAVPVPSVQQALVPAWWLFVATALGSLTTLAGALILR